VLAILHAHMRPAFDIIKDFRPFPSQERDIDLRFHRHVELRLPSATRLRQH
jgi:hypothetical protein